MRALFFVVDMNSSSYRLHFFTTGKCLDATFGMAFVMEPLMGDRPNGSERIPHCVVVIAERDD